MTNGNRDNDAPPEPPAAETETAPTDQSRCPAESEDGQEEAKRPLSPEEQKIERAKQLARIICICNGINLGRVLRGIEGCETVGDINRKVGTGSGGCKGERCGPRLKTLLRKRREAQGKD